jgi:hypothetical protein
MWEPAVHYATYFDRHYLSRGLALLWSLRRHDSGATIWVLCLDDETHRVLSRLCLENVRLITLAALERADPDLAAARGTRSLLEYYYTLTAPYLLHVLTRETKIDVLVYVDADLFFYTDPAPIYRTHLDAAILLDDHRYHPSRIGEYKYGRFNVGFMVFRDSRDRAESLRSWRAQCIEWCHDYVDGDRYGDQKYLDDWPNRFATAEIGQKGVGLAPWNVANYQLREVDGGVLVDSDPLINYHFHGLRIISRSLFDSNLHRHGHRMNAALFQKVYIPYIVQLQEASAAIEQITGKRFIADSVRRRRWYGPLVRWPPTLKLLQILAAVRRRNLLVCENRTTQVTGRVPMTRPVFSWWTP